MPRMGIFKNRKTGNIAYQYRDFMLGWGADAFAHTQANTVAVASLLADAVASLPVKIYSPEAEDVQKLTFKYGTTTALREAMRWLIAEGYVFVTYDRATLELEVLSGDALSDMPHTPRNLWRIDDVFHEDRKLALKPIMDETKASAEYRAQMWKRAGRIGGWLGLPQGVKMSPEAESRFSESWREFRNKGARAGETPLLQDGMTWHASTMSAREEQWAEIAEFNKRAVCNLYNVPPAMLSDKDVAKQTLTYFYTDTLAPWLRLLQEVFTEIVEEIVGEGYYVRFNIDAKLAGSFEEQAGVLSTATGAPWLTVNEARKIRDLPPIDGGDELVVPLNVLVGGQKSPQDGGELSQAVQNVKEVTK